MTQKCGGVKILDLEEKLEATGSEYIVTAEKDNNYKLPLESVADIVIGNSKFKAAIKDVYESSTPTYPEGWSGSDSNPNGYVWMSTATFSSKGTIVVPWSTPVRLTGADGHDGADGSIYIQKVLGSDTYSARLNPTEGLIFAKNSLTTKTYANA